MLTRRSGADPWRRLRDDRRGRRGFRTFRYTPPSEIHPSKPSRATRSRSPSRSTQAEFENDLDAAFKRLAKEVRLPGFRPGKAPRKVLEARIGSGYARRKRSATVCRTTTSRPSSEHEVDVIGPPEIDITDGEEDGAVTFDAVVEIRPSVDVSTATRLSRSRSLRSSVSDDDLDEAIDRMRGQFGRLVTVERAADDGDRVTIDIAAVHEGEPVDGLTTEDYIYEVGMGAVGSTSSTRTSSGASAGDALEFTADHPDEDEEEPLEFSITVNEVQASVLPEPDDEFAKANTEFDTIEELRADYRNRLEPYPSGPGHRPPAAMRSPKPWPSWSPTTTSPSPDQMEVENRAQDMAMRLQAQGLSTRAVPPVHRPSIEAMLAELREPGPVIGQARPRPAGHCRRRESRTHRRRSRRRVAARSPTSSNDPSTKFVRNLPKPGSFQRYDPTSRRARPWTGWSNEPRLVDEKAT